ncbi:hypothetical protein H0X06_07185, partial [Candidatus Dependentiae bacterium]|nr:hypothetical protein [Candidatus Dependentiae bacterium]
QYAARLGPTPCTVAVHGWGKDLVKELLSLGANPSVSNEMGSALLSAISRRSAKMFLFLVDKGAKVDNKMTYMIEPIKLPDFVASPRMVSTLLHAVVHANSFFNSNFLDSKTRESRNYRPGSKDHEKIIHFLVEEGYVSLDEVNECGETALELARFEANEKMAALLQSLKER